MNNAPDSDDPPKTDFLYDIWYFAALGGDLEKGSVSKHLLLGEPVLIGRTNEGKAFALRDICPHRGVPLSAGSLMPDNTMQCAYHGWRFRADDGQCRLIPSLVGGEPIKADNVRVRTYPVREQDGLIWIYMAAKGHEGASPGCEPPRVPLANAVPRWTERQIFNCAVDHAVIGLMDPAHAPYVHGRWWWRVEPKEKDKNYSPLPAGFVMKRHEPTKAAYKLLGADVSTEITFELPSTRFENIQGALFRHHVDVVGLTTCTPLDAERTLVMQTFFWPARLGFIRPFFWFAGRTFLSDDRRMVELQREGLKFDPHLMLIQDADVPAMWYHRLKKAWAESTASGAPFVNPLKEATLRWKS